MKKLFIAGALLIGIGAFMASKAGAVDRKGQGWNVTNTTGTSTTIFNNGIRGYLKAIYLSSATTTDIGGNYVMAFSTIPVPKGPQGGAPYLMYEDQVATTSLTPPILFNSSTTVTNFGQQFNNIWNAGDCDQCYIEIPASGGLTIRSSTEASGKAFRATVLWSQ